MPRENGCQSGPGRRIRTRWRCWPGARPHSHRGVRALSLPAGGAGAVCPAHRQRPFPRLPLAGQRYAVLLGALLFSTNFLCFYHVTLYIPSGMSAVIFASATIFNGLNLWLYEGFVWQRVSVMGVVFSLLGNLVIFARPCGSGAGGQPRRRTTLAPEAVSL